MAVLGIQLRGLWLAQGNLERTATDARVVKLKQSGHFIAEEQPAEALRLLLPFLRDAAPAVAGPRRSREK
jgi:pimeloyl-ACP methyl ester carboxylesterase